MSWLVFATIAGVALAAADFFVKLAAGKLSSSLGLLLYGSCTFLTGLLWVLGERIRGVPQHIQWAGALAALGVGVSFSAVTVGLYATFSAGAPISIASPFIRLGGLVLASVAGLLIFREPLTARYVLGMIVAGIGVYLIVTR